MRKGRATAPRGRSVPVLATICIAFAILNIGAVAGAISSHKKPLTPLQKGLAYFQGKTVTLLAPASPGGAGDLSARLVVPYLDSYLHATFNVADNGSGGSFPAQDIAAAAPPNGLLVGILSPVADLNAVWTDQPALNFNPAHVDFLAVGGPNLSIWVSRPSSPYTSWKSIVDAPASSPVTMLTLSSGATGTNMRLANAAFGIHASLLSGYASTAPMLAGFLRGDGPVSQFSVGMVGTSISGGVARPLLTTIPSPPQFTIAPYLKGVPTIAQFGKQYPPKTKRQQNILTALVGLTQGISGSIYYVPTRTPTDIVLALQAALKYALGPISRGTALAEGVVPGYKSGAVGKALYLQELALGPSVRPYLITG